MIVISQCAFFLSFASTPVRQSLVREWQKAVYAGHPVREVDAAGMQELFAVISKTLGEMQAKDWITVSVSVVALVVSIASFKQKALEYRLSIRKQLTDSIAKLNDLNVESAKARNPHKRLDYPEFYQNLINEQRRFSAKQADYLCEQIPDLVSPFEYMAIANGFSAVEDALQAEKYYHLALSPKLSGIERAMALREYARLLFLTGRSGEARKRYEEAISAAQGQADPYVMNRGDTYERWAQLEHDWGAVTRVGPLLNESQREYEKLTVQAVRQEQLARVQQRRTSLLQGPEPPHLPPQPLSPSPLPPTTVS